MDTVVDHMPEAGTTTEVAIFVVCEEVSEMIRATVAPTSPVPVIVKLF